MSDSNLHPNPSDSAQADGCERYLHSLIQSANTISFHDFMEKSLYDATHGYYSTTSSRVGYKGDFFTSVSVGEVFGKILAQRIFEFWQKIGSPEDFSITELGANNADLAVDILSFLAKTPLGQHLHYHIVEPLAPLQEIQKQNFQQANLNNFTLYNTLEQKPKTSGVFLCNELFDALPVERVQLHNGTWQQIRIASVNDAFQETLEAIPIDHPLFTFCENLGTNFPEGYTTEFCPNVTSLIEQLSQTLDKALVMIIDYGFPRSIYYDRSRNEGTLQTYSKHTKNAPPLESPGNQDITAHVDFTHLAGAALKAGFLVYDFVSQSRYLTHHGMNLLKEQEGSPDPTFIAQFQTLTHPGQMGHAFHVLELLKDIDLSSPLTHQASEVLELS